jgi:hypothetical protein
MVMGFIVLTGTGIKDTREWAPSATTALQLVRNHMKLRRPCVRIEDERGKAISFFELKNMAQRESHKKNALRNQGEPRRATPPRWEGAGRGAARDAKIEGTRTARSCEERTPNLAVCQLNK